MSEAIIPPLPPAEQECKNCAHENDSGTEYCGCCDGDPPRAWTESSWKLLDRAEAIITAERAQLAAIREAAGCKEYVAQGDVCLLIRNAVGMMKRALRDEGQLVAMRAALEKADFTIGKHRPARMCKAHQCVEARTEIKAALADGAGKSYQDVATAARNAAMAYTEGADPDVSEERMYEVCERSLKELAEAIAKLDNQGEADGGMK